MLEYAALVVSPRALPDGLILVFQHPVNTEPTDPRIPHREEFHELVLGTLQPKAGISESFIRKSVRESDNIFIHNSNHKGSIAPCLALFPWAKFRRTAVWKYMKKWNISLKKPLPDPMNAGQGSV